MNAFDSSALLAVAFDEPGAGTVVRLLADGPAYMSAVNLAEVYARYLRQDSSLDRLMELIRRYAIEIVPFDGTDAELVGRLHRATRENGLSLGDCICLALAMKRGLTAVTADRAWSGIAGLDVRVRAIR